MKKKWRLIVCIALMLSLLASISGCSPIVKAEEEKVKAGIYVGKAEGYHGDIEVEVSISEDEKLADIVIKNHTETEGIGTIATDEIPKKIIEKQSLDVDAISGATVTSKAIQSAIANALKNSDINPEKFGFVSIDNKEKEEIVTLNMDAIPEKQKKTDTVEIVDAKGRKVNIDLPISTYAVSTMDVIDYIIPLKGKDAFNMLVASGQDGGKGIQKYQKLYKDVVGNYMEHVGQISDHNAPFDLEMILAMNPDVLIVNSAMSAHKYALEIEEQLTSAGIKLVLIDVPGKNLQTSVQDTMKILGQVFQEEQKAIDISAFIDKQYQIIASKNLEKRTDKPTVYYEKSGYSQIYGSTSSSKSGWGEPIKIAGGDNIADPLLANAKSGKGGNNTLDPEYVIESNPDFIILSGVNDGWLDIIKKEKEIKFDIVNRTGWRELNAIKNENLYEFAHATNRSIYAFYPCLKMAKLFYPDEFDSVNPDEVLEEFFNKYMILDSNISTWFIELNDVK